MAARELRPAGPAGPAGPAAAASSSSAEAQPLEPFVLAPTEGQFTGSKTGVLCDFVEVEPLVGEVFFFRFIFPRSFFGFRFCHLIVLAT